MSIRGIIFDLGWTLLDFVGDVQAADAQRAADLGAFLAGYGFDVDGAAVFAAYRAEMEKLRQAGGPPLNYEYPGRLGMLLALRHHVGEAHASRLAAGAIAASYTNINPLWQPYPDMANTLTALRDAGYRLGAISNTDDGAHVWIIVDQYDLRQWLVPIFMSDQVGLRKPNPHIFHKVLDEWDLPPEQVVMVGDTLDADVLGAHNAGLRGIWIDRGQNNPWNNNEQNMGNITPDAAIKQLAELPALLEYGLESP